MKGAPSEGRSWMIASCEISVSFLVADALCRLSSRSEYVLVVGWRVETDVN